jgi:undecaprenyl-diphosphatase
MRELDGFLSLTYGWVRDRWKRLSVLLLCILLPLLLVGALAEDVLEGGLPWDVPILRWVHGSSTAGLDRVMIVITRLGYAWGTVPLALGVLATLVARRRWSRARFFTVAVGGAMAINGLAKLVFRRVRPSLWTSLTPETSYSFPSGHAMGSMALVAALLVLAWPTRARWWVPVPGALFVLLVGISRVYLGVHYPSDVLAGWAASLAWVTGVAWLAFGGVFQSREQGA